MALPHTNQSIARHMAYRGLKHADVADAVGINRVRFSNLVKGKVYLSPVEAASIETYFASVPIQSLFDADVRAYVDNWPPPHPSTALRTEVERLRAAVERDGDR